MKILNSPSRYGLIAVILHWLVAVTVIGLFTLGIWMTGLDYYDAWYQRAPDWHKGIGSLLFVAVGLRLVWHWASPSPAPLANHSRLEHLLARAMHRLLDILLIAVSLAGYFISTANGRPIEVFGLFSIPATLSGIDNQEDIAGVIHEWLAYTLIVLAGLHASAALKHHIIDRDSTLKRMLGL